MSILYFWDSCNITKIMWTSVCLMMIHFVTPTKDRPNHGCSKNHVKSGERDLAKTKISPSLKSKFTCVFCVRRSLRPKIKEVIQQWNTYFTIYKKCNNHSKTTQIDWGGIPKHLLVSTLSAPTMQPVPDKLTKLFASGSYYEIPIAISLAGAQLQYTN
jgi:hypothetical protein